jgi:hypothetical protein
MTPKQAIRELRELGYNLTQERANGGQQWRLGVSTVFIPAKSHVAESIIRTARRHALNLSIATVPVLQGHP